MIIDDTVGTLQFTDWVWVSNDKKGLSRGTSQYTNSIFQKEIVHPFDLDDKSYVLCGSELLL